MIRALRIDAAARVLEIAWADGGADAIAFATLRSRCMCAECRSTRQQGRAIEVADDLGVTDVVPYGPNAVQLVFSDRHSRGIFPFAYLRELASSDMATTEHR